MDRGPSVNANPWCAQTPRVIRPIPVQEVRSASQGPHAAVKSRAASLSKWKANSKASACKPTRGGSMGQGERSGSLNHPTNRPPPPQRHFFSSRSSSTVDPRQWARTKATRPRRFLPKPALSHIPPIIPVYPRGCLSVVGVAGVGRRKNLSRLVCVGSLLWDERSEGRERRIICAHTMGQRSPVRAERPYFSINQSWRSIILGALERDLYTCYERAMIERTERGKKKAHWHADPKLDPKSQLAGAWSVIENHLDSRTHDSSTIISKIARVFCVDPDPGPPTLVSAYCTREARVTSLCLYVCGARRALGAALNANIKKTRPFRTIRFWYCVFDRTPLVFPALLMSAAMCVM